MTEEMKTGTVESTRGTQLDESIYSNTVYRLGQLCQRALIANSIGRYAHHSEYPFVSCSIWNETIELVVYNGEARNGCRDTEKYSVHAGENSSLAEVGICRMIDRVDDVMDERRRLYEVRI